MAEPITVKHFFSGLIQPKTAVKSLAFGTWFVIFAVVGWAIYLAYVKPHYNPLKTRMDTYQAEEIIHEENTYYEAEKAVFIGVELWGWKLGIVKNKPVKKEANDIVQKEGK